MDIPLNELTAKLELLIDGELSDEERSELLMYLDSVPDGWRICSAMFLEAQAVREAVLKFYEPTPEPILSVPRTIDAIPDVKTSNGRFSVSQLVAMIAVAVVLTIAVGSFSTAYFRNEQHRVAGQLLSAVPDAWSEENPFGVSATPERRLVSLNTDHEIELPLFSSETVDPAAFGTYCSVAPALLEQLRRQGQELYVKRHDVVITLKDGSYAIVPIETINVRFKDKKGNSKKSGSLTVYGPGVLFNSSEENHCKERIADFMGNYRPDEDELKFVLSLGKKGDIDHILVNKGTTQWNINSIEELPQNLGDQVRAGIKACTKSAE